MLIIRKLILWEGILMWSYKNPRNKILVASILIIILIILFFKIQSIQVIMISSTPMPEISVDPALQAVQKGEEFSINISINPADAPILAGQFNLLFDNSVIDIKKVTEGDLFKQGGAKTAFNFGTLDKKRGILINVWGLIIKPGANVTKKGSLATITMYANNSGTSKLNLSGVIISDPGGNSIRIKITNGSVITFQKT
jgi:hypothetical protein